MAAAPTADAGFVVVFSRAALGGNDLVDWHAAPANFDNPGDQFSMTSLGGL